MHAKASVRHPDMGFQIAPMIDVVFVIMLFFMVMAGQVKVEHELQMKLPGVPNESVAQTLPDELTIAVGETGRISLNDTQLDGDDALPRLTRDMTLLADNAKRTQNPLLVTVQAEDTTRYEHIAGVLNALAAAGASKHVTFAIADGE